MKTVISQTITRTINIINLSKDLLMGDQRKDQLKEAINIFLIRVKIIIINMVKDRLVDQGIFLVRAITRYQARSSSKVRLILWLLSKVCKKEKWIILQIIFLMIHIMIHQLEFLQVEIIINRSSTNSSYKVIQQM